MADLHRLPHRLGDAAPGRVDQRARGRARDENPRQVEQQRRVLVAARIEPAQRHRQFAPADIGVADQVEGGVGRDEAALRERAQQMRAAAADHRFDLGQACRALRRRRRLGVGMAEIDGVEQRRDRLADRGPVRRLLVARGDQRLAQPLQPRFFAQLGQSRAAQQRAQRRIAKRGPVELGEMRIAAARVQEHRIADVIERGAILPGRQRAVGGTGEMLKGHRVSFGSFFSSRPAQVPWGAATSADSGRRPPSPKPASG